MQLTNKNYEVMKRFLAVNQNNTAVAVSGNFSKCVDLVADETERGDLS